MASSKDYSVQKCNSPNSVVIVVGAVADAVNNFFGYRSSGSGYQIHAEQRRYVVGGPFNVWSWSWNHKKKKKNIIELDKTNGAGRVVNAFTFFLFCAPGQRENEHKKYIKEKVFTSADCTGRVWSQAKMLFEMLEMMFYLGNRGFCNKC